MKALDIQIVRNGYVYKQHKRGKKAMIYSQHLSVSEPPIQYETFKLFITKNSVLPNGVKMEAHETFPSNSVFGKWAWSYKTEESAIEKFNELELRNNDE